MCIPNKILSLGFLNDTCPGDNMKHFTVNFSDIGKATSCIDPEETTREEAYEANVHFNYNAHGKVISIDVCLIAPMPDIDPDEPIPYRLTEKGKEAVRSYPNMSKDYPGTMEELGW